MKRRKWQVRIIYLRYTGYKRFTAGFPGYQKGIKYFCGLSIAPATPSFRLAGSHKDGLCGPEQRNGVGQGKTTPVTVAVIRLVVAALL
jgi:hypothetical protein